MCCFSQSGDSTSYIRESSDVLFSFPLRSQRCADLQQRQTAKDKDNKQQKTTTNNKDTKGKDNNNNLSLTSLTYHTIEVITVISFFSLQLPRYSTNKKQHYNN